MARRRTYSSRRAEISDLRRRLVDDSIDREKMMTRLLKVVRTDERENTLETLNLTKVRAEDRS